MRAIDQLIDQLHTALPGVSVEQLKVKYPSDDDGLWFVRHPSSRAEVNIESSTGEFPFLIENNDGAVTTDALADAVDAVIRALGLSVPANGKPGVFETGGIRAWVERESIHLVADMPASGDSAELSAADARRLADALLKMAGQLQH